MNTIKEVNSAIMFGNFTNDELSSILDAVKWARSQLSKQNANSFRRGDTVKFTDRKRGVTFKGTVDSVKIKYALVQTPQGRYNVPLNMLESA
jgi:hypothetical protein